MVLAAFVGPSGYPGFGASVRFPETNVFTSVNLPPVRVAPWGKFGSGVLQVDAAVADSLGHTLISTLKTLIYTHLQLDTQIIYLAVL